MGRPMSLRHQTKFFRISKRKAGTSVTWLPFYGRRTPTGFGALAGLRFLPTRPASGTQCRQRRRMTLAHDNSDPSAARSW